MLLRPVLSGHSVCYWIHTKSAIMCWFSMDPRSIHCCSVIPQQQKQLEQRSSVTAISASKSNRQVAAEHAAPAAVAAAGARGGVERSMPGGTGALQVQNPNNGSYRPKAGVNLSLFVFSRSL